MINTQNESKSQETSLQKDLDVVVDCLVDLDWEVERMTESGEITYKKLLKVVKKIVKENY